MNELRIFQFAGKLTESMTILRDAGQTVPALMLAYAAMDQMAWLSISQEKSVGADFKAWVGKYVLPKLPVVVSAEELWEARNGLLHTGTADSQANQRDTSIRKVFYTVGRAECTRNDSSAVVFVKAEHLFEAFFNGALWFVEDLKGDQQKLIVALQKLDRMLTEQGLPESQ